MEKLISKSRFMITVNILKDLLLHHKAGGNTPEVAECYPSIVQKFCKTYYAYLDKIYVYTM